MQHENPVENLLQLQLSSDALAVLYLPSILSVLSPVHFSSDATASSSKAGGVSQVAPMTPALLNKWCTRVLSLMQSKDTGARWAGICLARKTGELRRDVVVEYAQRWISLTLPSLSRTEPLPVWKASIDLLVFIFMATSHLSEFRRQVSTPTVPKLSSALLELSSKGDTKLNLLILSSLATLISKFPTLHRSLIPQINSLIMPYLAGSFPPAYPSTMVQAAAHLLATMHHTEGKVGGPLAWRNTMDSVLYEAWKCVGLLQSSLVRDVPPTFTPKKVFEFPLVSNDPLVAIQVLLARLNNMIVAIDALFRINPSRPVLVPIATLANVTIRLLRSTGHVSISQKQGDAVRIQLERQVVPELVKAGASLACILVTSLRKNMTPHSTPILSSMVYQLELDMSPSRRYHLLQCLTTVMDHINSHAPLLPARIFRAVVPSLSPLLPTTRAIDSVATATGDNEGGRKGKGKKRKGFEGDESLVGGGEGTMPMDPEEGNVILQALEVLRRVLRMLYLPASLHSLGTRLLLSLHSHITSNPPSDMGGVVQGTNVAFHTALQAKLIELQGELSLGTAGHAWRGMNLTMQLLSKGDEDTQVSNATESTLRLIDALIHPRLPPPTLRKLPAPESLMLFNHEETREEKEERVAMRLQDGMGLGMDVEVQEVIMDAPVQLTREEGTRVNPADNVNGAAVVHAMDVEVDALKPLSAIPIPQPTIWTQEPTSTREEGSVQSDMMAQTPKGFGFGSRIAPEETIAIPIYQPALQTTSVHTVVTQTTKTIESTQPQFADPGEMSDEGSLPSIDMGSDSE